MSWTELSDLLAKFVLAGGGRTEWSSEQLQMVGELQKLMSVAEGDSLKKGDIVLPRADVVLKHFSKCHDSFSGLEFLSEEGDFGQVRCFLEECGYPIVKRTFSAHKMYLTMDRSNLTQMVLETASKIHLKNNLPVDLNFVNVERERVVGSTQLSLLRAEVVTESLRRFAGATCSRGDSGQQKVSVRVGCSDKRDLLRSDEDALCCQVGAVTRNGKKERGRGLLDVYREIFRRAQATMRDGQKEAGNETTSRADSHKMASACLRLHLLSGATSKPCQMDTNILEKHASVFYNYARLLQLSKAYEKNPSYPALAPLNECQAHLLSQELEWKLVLQLLRFEDVALSVVRDYCRSEFHIQKLPRYLAELSRDVSRYYRSVRILLDPLPHLLSVVEARMHLVKAIIRTFDEAFYLLSVEPIGFL